MINIHDINNFLKVLLDPDNINDYGLNGIQVENDIDDIKKIALAVDASVDSIDLTSKNNCKILIVHHGIFWGKPVPVSGAMRKKIKLLLDNNIGLIAYHLPLDSHRVYGNNIQILNKIGAIEFEPFGYDKGLYIGHKGVLSKPKDINEIYDDLDIDKDNIKYLNFGKKKIKTIAAVSGSGGKYLHEAVIKELDLYIIGDFDHIIYHKAKENNINVLLAGHYYTETFGLLALKKILEKQFKIEALFFDIPTGL